MGEEDDTVDGGAADMRGPAASGCEQGRWVRRRGRRAGPARGPRVRWEDGKGWQANWAGWLAWAEQAEAVCEAYILSLLFLFCLSFHLFCLNSNLVLKFEFQIGAPNLLELLSIS